MLCKAVRCPLCLITTQQQKVAHSKVCWEWKGTNSTETSSLEVLITEIVWLFFSCTHPKGSAHVASYGEFCRFWHPFFETQGKYYYVFANDVALKLWFVTFHTYDPPIRSNLPGMLHSSTESWIPHMNHFMFHVFVCTCKCFVFFLVQPYKNVTWYWPIHM